MRVPAGFADQVIEARIRGVLLAAWLSVFRAYYSTFAAMQIVSNATALTVLVLAHRANSRPRTNCMLARRTNAEPEGPDPLTSPDWPPIERQEFAETRRLPSRGNATPQASYYCVENWRCLVIVIGQYDDNDAFCGHDKRSSLNARRRTGVPHHQKISRPCSFTAPSVSAPHIIF